MTKSLEELKADFAARGGKATVAPVGVAYGVNSEADKAKRQEERDRKSYRVSEQEAEIRQQRGVEENGYYKS